MIVSRSDIRKRLAEQIEAQLSISGFSVSKASRINFSKDAKSKVHLSVSIQIGLTNPTEVRQVRSRGFQPVQTEIEIVLLQTMKDAEAEDIANDNSELLLNAVVGTAGLCLVFEKMNVNEIGENMIAHSISIVAIHNIAL